MIVVRIWEGLGNQLFQYAYAKSLQLRTGQQVYLDVGHCDGSLLDSKRTNREFELKYFRITLPALKNVERHYFFLNEKNSINKGIKWLAEENLYPYQYYEEKKIAFNKNLLYIHGNIYMQGWFQNEKYFSEYGDVIRKEFRLKKKTAISKELRELLEARNTVSIHIRRGDYKKMSNVLPAQYYHNAVEMMKERVEAPFFLIFSDEIGWVKQNMIFKSECSYINENGKLTDYEELTIMKHCRHHIIANSTFSWWGAWLNERPDKIVIGPRNWFLRNKSDLYPNIMPSDWIRL